MRKAVSSLITAIGLLVLAAGLLLLVPDTPPVHLETVEQGADDPKDGQIETSPTEDGNEVGTSQPVREARTVYGRQRDEEPLRRVAPRKPLSDLAAPENEPDPIKRRLLPRPVAVDAGRLKIGQATVVLPGIDAPDADARCDSGGRSWPCGAQARTALRAYLRGRSVECMTPSDFGERNETVTSTCTLAGEDVARWIVANGWARAMAEGPYAELENEARQAKRGLWR
ncbi:hypothetical protein FP2506_08226 [Fulvimarina pelagi HTCC2506]|uniref:TNase-like domain-containing protein n=1 Tax=Fulvimarina pelagi HTCC2506 TaxID=314231 RepID=Q0G6A1_9HYPH|nr:thermonuclease family protein [Fulvimarina pelagi]EAU42813.1 hypothetical protein FP2506_08226 [Fulvimarina pelagi HTCC2506]